MSSNYQKTLKGLSTQTIVTIILGLLELLVFSIMSRLLSKEDFGYYAAIMAVIVILRSLAEAGIGSSVIQKKDASKEYVDTAFVLALAAGVFFTIVIVVFSQPIIRLFADESILIPFLLTSLTIVPYSINSVYRGLLMKKLNFGEYGIYQIISFVISNSVGIIMAVKGWGLLSIVIANILYIWLQNIIMLIRIDKRPQFHFYKQHFHSILSFGGWLSLSRLLTSIYTQIDKLLMGRFLSIGELGAYYRTRGFIDSIDSQLGGIFDVILFPILSNLQDNLNSVRNAYVKVMYFGALFFSLLFLIFVFNTELLIYIFLGEKWLDQSTIFRILSLSMLFYFINRLADCFIRSLAYVRFQFNLKILSCLLLFLGIYIGVKWGTVGVTISVVLINLIIGLIKVIYVCRKIEVPFCKLLKSMFLGIKYSLPLIVSGVVFYFLVDKSLSHLLIFAVSFFIETFVLFMFFPTFVGVWYKQYVFSKIENKFLKSFSSIIKRY